MGNKNSVFKMIKAPIPKSNPFNRLNLIINPFQNPVVVFILKRVFYKRYVFLHCADGGFHIFGLVCNYNRCVYFYKYALFYRNLLSSYWGECVRGFFF